MAGILDQLRPLWQQLEQQRGLPLGYLDRTAKVESSYNPNARNPNSSAGGMFQFIDDTARAKGLTNKFDPFAASEAAASLAADNAAYLRKNGIEPTAGNLYLAHQQGPKGAVKLLQAGDAPASSVVGGAEAGLNGGGGLSSNAMADKWRSKFADLDGTATPPTQGSTDMAGAADLPAPGASPAIGQTESAFAPPSGTPNWGQADQEQLMMALALIQNAIPNGQVAKGVGEITMPFMNMRSKREDRQYQRGRDAKSDAQWQKSFEATQGNRTQDNARADAGLDLQREAAKRAWQAEDRANAKPLIQEFKDDAGNSVYKQFDMGSRQWVPLSAGAPSAVTPGEPIASPTPPTAGSPAMDGGPTLSARGIPAAGPAPALPPPPPGVNRQTWYQEQTKRLAAEAGGPKGDDISGLRKEVRDLPSYKNVAQAAPVYRSMADAVTRDDRASDVNLIYGMAKIMDPGSVVRESEMTVAQAIATLPQQLAQAVKSQIESTGRLSSDVRDGIMREAYSRMNAYNQMYGQDAEQFKGIAERRKMDVNDILPNFGEFKPWERPKGATPGATPGGSTGDGRQTKVINGKTYVKEKNSSSWFEE